MSSFPLRSQHVVVSDPQEKGLNLWDKARTMLRIYFKRRFALDIYSRSTGHWLCRMTPMTGKAMLLCSRL